MLIEAETTPGYHSTGRSAALYTGNYGVDVVRRINKASHAFYLNPPDGFGDAPLLTPRGMLTVAAPGNEDGLSKILDLSAPGFEVEKLDAASALRLAPLLRPERVAAAAYEASVMDINVSALHQGFLRGVKQRGGVLAVNKRVEKLDRREGQWQIAAGGDVITARVVVNAAGAWAEQVGAMAGARPVGLVPKRRTAIIVDSPVEVGPLPTIDFVGSDAYIKPDAGRLMVSPGDQTPIEPQDVQPDEWDIAVLVDWLQTETLVSVSRIGHSWAGLRSFVTDGAPVVGFDAAVPDFFWLAGQGGYGIMMAPALGRAVAELIVAGALPDDFLASGLAEADISPSRAGLAQ